MPVINQTTAPPNGSDVFSPMIYEFSFSSATCSFVDLSGIAAIDVPTNYSTLLPLGSNVRIIDGAYIGVYRITAVTPGSLLRLTLNTLYIGSSASTGSSRFAPEGAQDFQLITGYSEGAGAAEKPWQVSDEIRVSPNLSGIYRFDISGYIRTRFSIVAPVEGPNVPISIRHAARLKSATAIPTDSEALTAYYGLEDLTSPQQNGDEAVGERPILFFGNAPTLYSLALAKGIISNFISDPGKPAQTTSGTTVDARLLSCEPKIITWLGVAPTSGFTVTPALPSWITATADGDSIDLVINPCSAGVGDYLAADYNPIDYLTSGVVNSVTGCFSFVFDSGGALFTLGICVTPISEIVNVCSADVLNFAWLNQRGGFSSFAVEAKYVNGREFGGDSTVVDAAGRLKRVNFRDVYDVTEVSGGVLSKVQLDMLSSLRSSIQVYLYNRSTEAFDIPVVFDRSSFQTYGNRFNQSETRFSFRYRKAQQVNIQTQ